MRVARVGFTRVAFAAGAMLGLATLGGAPAAAASARQAPATQAAAIQQQGPAVKHAFKVTIYPAYTTAGTADDVRGDRREHVLGGDDAALGAGHATDRVHGGAPEPDLAPATQDVREEADVLASSDIAEARAQDAVQRDRDRAYRVRQGDRAALDISRVPGNDSVRPTAGAPGGHEQRRRDRDLSAARAVRRRRSGLLDEREHIGQHLRRGLQRGGRHAPRDARRR